MTNEEFNHLKVSDIVFHNFGSELDEVVRTVILEILDDEIVVLTDYGSLKLPTRLIFLTSAEAFEDLIRSINQVKRNAEDLLTRASDKLEDVQARLQRIISQKNSYSTKV